MLEQLGRYRIIEDLGRGGMGTIHLAVIGGIGRFRKLFVLKVLREDLTRDPQFIDLFLREAAVAGSLSHPNVVHTVEAGCEGDRYFLVMEFLDGQPFSQILRSAHRFPVIPLPIRLRVVCDVLAGLHYVHELADYDGRSLDLVHRDVSPPNVFVTYDGQVKLLDFGIAKARDDEDSRPGEFKGKIGYAAPEQLRGEPADRRIDVFSAGVVLWEAIALRHLALGKSRRDAFAARLAGTDPRIAEVVPDVDRELATICDRAMHHDPERRYATAQEFGRALEGYLGRLRVVVDSDDVGQLMRVKFAEERAKMHCLIDQVMRESFVPPAPSLGPAELPERSGHPAFPAAATPPPPPDLHDAESDPELAAPFAVRRGPRVAVVAGSAVAALAAALFLGRGCEARSPSERATAVQSAATPKTPPAPRAPAVALERAAPTELEDASAVSMTRPSNSTVEARDAASSGLPSALPTESAREKRGSKREPPRRGERRDPARAVGATNSSPAADAAAPSELDLRGVRRRTPRRLDVENPFR